MTEEGKTSAMTAGTTVQGPTTSDEFRPELDVHAAYDGSNVLFHLLRMTTWGPGLMNLGWFRFRGPFAWMNHTCIAPSCG